MKNPKLFISRDLSSESLLFRELSKQTCTFFATSLIQFSPIPFQISSDVDSCFFYSKNGVRFFLDQLKITRESFSAKSSNRQMLAKMTFGCFGRSTAKELASYGYASELIGTHNLGQIASEIATQWRGKKILFPQARQSRNSLQVLTDNFIEYLPLVVYDNTPKPEVPLPFTPDVLVFTSPMNARAYLSLGYTFEGKTIIAIGRTTANQLKRLTMQPVHCCKNPSEQDLWDIIKKSVFRISN